jgi:hypothetical protein
MGRHALTIATVSRHGPELILRYLDAAWADCVVSVQTGAALFCAPAPMGRVRTCAIVRQGSERACLREVAMEDSSKEHAVGYKRPPKSGQFRKGRSGNPGGRRRKNSPVRVDAASILDETFRVSIGGLTQSMSAKEIEIRQILKKALEKRDFRSIAHLLLLFEKHGCVTVPKTCGVLTLPTNKMPRRMALIILEKYGLPEQWTKRQIAWGRKQYEATMTDIERQCEAAGIIP